MHTAALHGHKEVLRILLAAGGNPTATDNGGNQPIHEAAAGGNVACLDLLMGVGVDLSVVDACGCSPLHRAASAGHVMAARWLIEVWYLERSFLVNTQLVEKPSKNRSIKDGFC